MTTCYKCGLPIEFVTVDGVRRPLHSCRSNENYDNFYGYGGVSYSLPGYSSYYSKYSSYTNPNAKCPVCNASVYYYESEHGGKVFFDELGPPWPKHPCTDRSLEKSLPKAVASWKKSGWTPFWVENCFEIFGVQTVEGKILNKKSEKKLSLSLRSDQNVKWIDNWVGNPMFIKRIKSKKNRFGHSENPTHVINTILFDDSIGFHEVEVLLVISYNSEYC